MQLLLERKRNKEEFNLPEGFKFIVKTKVRYHNILPPHLIDIIGESKFICYEIIGDIIYDIFNTSITEPFIKLDAEEDVIIEPEKIHKWTPEVTKCYIDMGKEYKKEGMAACDALEDGFKNFFKGKNINGETIIHPQQKKLYEEMKLRLKKENKQSKLFFERKREIEGKLEKYKNKKKEDRKKRMEEMKKLMEEKQKEQQLIQEKFSKVQEKQKQQYDEKMSKLMERQNKLKENKTKNEIKKEDKEKSKAQKEKEKENSKQSNAKSKLNNHTSKEQIITSSKKTQKNSKTTNSFIPLSPQKQLQKNFNENSNEINSNTKLNSNTKPKKFNTNIKSDLSKLKSISHFDDSQISDIKAFMNLKMEKE